MLDDDAQRFLAQLNSSTLNAPSWPTIAQSRAGLSAIFTKYSPKFCPVKRHRHGLLNGKSGEFPIDIFWPNQKESSRKLPLVIFIHGGGWIQGDLACYENLVRTLCEKSGSVVINVGYHLAPEHKFPAGLEDCYTALTWAKEQANNLGIDTDRIAIMGDSAGGNLCAALIDLNQQRSNIPLNAQFLLYPVLDVTDELNYPSHQQFGQGNYFLATEHVYWTRQHYLEDQGLAYDPLVSPIHNEHLGKRPRTFILTAGYDPLRDEAELYSQKLNTCGTTCEYYCMPNTLHGFLSLAGCLKSGQLGLELLSQKLQNYQS